MTILQAIERLVQSGFMSKMLILIEVEAIITMTEAHMFEKLEPPIVYSFLRFLKQRRFTFKRLSVLQEKSN